MKVSATGVKDKQDQMLERAPRRPSPIESSNHRHGPSMLAEHFDTPVVAAQSTACRRSGRRTADPGRGFYGRHKTWFDAQNDPVDRFGIPGERFRPW
jgi:hypothetical protein